MAKKKLSVGVAAAIVTALAVVIAAIIPLLRHEEPKATQSISNSNGNIQAGRDVIIQHSDQPANVQYNTTLAKNYDDKFENMTQKRAEAGVVVLEYLSKDDWNLVTNNTDGLDDVLGFFDLMGYDEQHNNLNPDVVYEYFCEDIMAYYQACKDYIAKVQKSDGATVYANIKPLFDTMVQLESEKEHTNTVSTLFDKKGLVEYFVSETNSVNLKER